jgi:aminoglycoside phosphotransferase family enzyme/predicted kinase
VSALTRKGDTLEFDGPGEVVEYCVRMRRFDERATLDHLVSADKLTRKMIADLASAIVRSHALAPRRDFDSAAALDRLIRENSDSLREYAALFPQERTLALTSASLSILRREYALLVDRRRAGFVRRCHGDLHLGNIVMLSGEPVLFDALEFDEDMASIDVLYDLAYLVMDLWERGFSQAANAVLNQYLWQTDEAHLAGLAVLPLFLSLRAAIRAKVIAASLPYREAALQGGLAADARRYFGLAEAFLVPAAPRLVAIGGLSGAGKTTVAEQIAPRIGRPPGAVHLRSDIERKRLFGIAHAERLPQVDYTPATSAQVYAEVRRKSGIALAAGACIIADAVHQRRGDRDAIASVALGAGVSFTRLWLDVAADKRVERVEGRSNDASDATPEVARRQTGYDLGEISWRRIDTAGSLNSSVAKALDALGPDGGGSVA